MAVCGGEKLMDIAHSGSIIFRKGRGLSFSKGQVALLFLLLGVGSGLIFATIQQASLNSVFLLCLVSIAGIVLCRKTQIRLNDPSLNVLGYFWLIKLGLTLCLLYAGWMPQLQEASSSAWGYDPQRYYIQAQELIDNGWLPDFVSLNYVGILYYYGAIYYFLGHNPVIPALINAFVTLIASLYLVRVGYEIKSQRRARDWTLAFVLLLPEMLWFDVMTSRETLLAALLLFSMLTTGRYLARTSAISLTNVFIINGFSLLGIAAVRTSMLFPVIVSIVLMLLLVKPKSGSRIVQRAVLGVTAVVVFIVGPVIAGFLGGYEFDVGKTIQVATSAGGNIALNSNMEWSESSIGMLLMPEGLFQSVLFLPPRMLLYLVAPLPNILVPVSDLLVGNWSAWQRLLTLLSSVTNLLGIPFVLASLVRSIKRRKDNTAPFVFHISYWVTFMAIAGGNLIIHERYRVMATFLLWVCAWLGAQTCSRRLIVRMSLVWYGLLTLSGLFYIGYKLGLA